MKKFYSTAASFVFIILAIFYFIWLSPLMSDNFVFSREIIPGYAQFYSGARVDARPLTVAGSFRQAWEMYFTWCGRFCGNLSVYLLFMLPHWLYSLLAACCFGLYVWLLQMCVFGRQWRQHFSPGWILAIAALLWFAVPSFGEAFFWLSVGGQIALLGQAAMLLPYRFALDDLQPKKFPAALITASLFFCAGIFVASLDYPASASLPLTTLACCVWLWLKNSPRKFPAVLFAGSLGLCLGAFLTLAAPGNTARTSLTRDPSVHAYMDAAWPDRLMNWLLHLPGAMWMQILPLFLLGIGCFILWREYGRKWWRQFPAAAWLFILPAALIHGAYLMTAWPPPRAFAGSAVMLLVAGIIVLARAKKGAKAIFAKRIHALAVFLGIACAASLLWEGVKFYNLHQIIETREKILLAARDSATIPAMPPGSGDRYWVLGKYLYDLSTDANFWINRAMSAHYNLREVRAEGGTTTLHDLDWRQDKIEARLADGTIYASYAKNQNIDSPRQLHFYYWGEPALLCRAPFSAGKKIFKWLADGEQGTLKKWLVPILLARSDISLQKEKDGRMIGSSPQLKLYSGENLWITRPGAGAASFDVLPMRRLNQEKE